MGRIQYKQGLKISDHILALEDMLRSRQLGGFVESFLQTWGISAYANSSGDIGNAFRVRIPGGTSYITVDAGKALVKDPYTGSPVVLNNPVSLLVPALEESGGTLGNGHLAEAWPSSTSQAVVLKYYRSSRIPLRFKVQTGGSSPVLRLLTNAPGEDATQLYENGGTIKFSEMFRAGMRILLTTDDSTVAANQGVFTIASVSDGPTNFDITLNTTYETLAGTSNQSTAMNATGNPNVYVRPAGWFFTGFPATTPDKEIAYFDSWQIKFEATNYSPAEDELILADVTWTGSNATAVTDRRDESLLTFIPGLFRKLKPAIPTNVRFQWGFMETAPQSGRVLRDTTNFAIDQVHDFVPTKVWLRFKWGWSGTGHWSSGSFVIDSLDDGETQSFASNQLTDAGLGGTYYIYVNGERYAITGNAATSGTTTVNVSNGLSSGSGIPFTITPDCDHYEMQFYPIDPDGNEVTKMTRSAKVFDSSPGVITQEWLFEDVNPGIRFRFKVRSANGTEEGIKSSWVSTSGLPASNTAAGVWEYGYDAKVLPIPPTMSPCIFDSVDNGVRVSFTPAYRAAAYFCSYTLDAAPPAAPSLAKFARQSSVAGEGSQANSAIEVFHLGPTTSLSFMIHADPGTTVRATVWCIDQYGQQSENFISNSDGTLAGGVTIGANQKVATLQNKSVAGTDNTADLRVLGRIRLPRPCIIEELSVNIDSLTLNSDTRAYVAVYMEGQSGQAIWVGFTAVGISSTQQLEAVINTGGWLVVTAYDDESAATSPNLAAFTGDVYVTYRENDIRLQRELTTQSTGQTV